jgi:hypothetical protein
VIKERKSKEDLKQTKQYAFKTKDKKAINTERQKTKK